MRKKAGVGGEVVTRPSTGAARGEAAPELKEVLVREKARIKLHLELLHKPRR